uniref:Thioredoxin n=1 Tax=Ruditapes philippinarum TaxID=129788 RepID=C8CBN1_RUDPH|nr:thioredoxin A [Ruditapes philippinarum]
MKMLESKDEWDKFHKDAGDSVVAVDFTASWCGPCKMIGPKFEAMESEFPSIKFAKVDVDENEDVAQEQGISAMPTFKFYKNKKQVKDLVGASEPKLREILKELSA